MKKEVIQVLTFTMLGAVLLGGCQANTEKSSTSNVSSSAASAATSESDEAEVSDSQTDTETSSASTATSASSEEDGLVSVAKATDTLVVALGSDPLSLDPAYADDVQSKCIIAEVSEGLVKFDSNTTNVIPSLAKSWEISEDQLTYTFHLRTGVRFQDGTAFDADAVVYNVNRLTTQVQEGMTHTAIYEHVKACRAIDAETVEIELDTPYTPFLRNLAASAAAIMVSPAACDAAGGRMDEMLVGTGPYACSLWTKEDGNIILEKNEDYWGTPAITEHLVFQTITDLTLRVEALKKGAVDICEDLDAAVMEDVTSASLTVINQPGLSTSYMAFNTEKLTDQKVREALIQSVDVEAVNQQLYQEYAEAAVSVLPSSVEGHQPHLMRTAYDPEAAQTYFEENDLTFVHIITYTDSKSYNTSTGQVLADAVQSCFDAAGAVVSIDAYPWDEYLEKVQEGDYDVCFYGIDSDNGDPDSFLKTFSGTDWLENVTRYQNPEYDTWITQADTMKNGLEREIMYSNAEQQLATDAVVLPISHQNTLCGYNPNLEDLVVSVDGYIDYSKITKNEPSILG